MGTSTTYDVSEMLRCEVSLFSSVFGKEAKRYTLGSVLKNFTTSRYAKTIREARGYLRNGDYEMYKACKSMLPVVAFCGVFKEGHSKANLVRYNNIVIIDIDHLSEESLSTVAQQLQQDEYVFAYWKSPSGQGLKGLVRIGSEEDVPLDEHHRQAFRQLTDYFHTQYSIDIDQSGSDYSRLCYACWDEGLVVKETAKVFEVKQKTELEAKHTDNSRPQVKNQTTRKGSDRQADIDTVRNIIRYLRDRGRSITHDYENWVRVAYAIADTFSPKRGEAFFLLLSQQDADKFDPDACSRLLDYCYDHTGGQVSLGTIVYLAQKEGYRKEIPFEEMTASEFLDAILAGDKRADEAMYYLLQERLNKQLKRKFEVYESQLLEGFEDVLEDFFLYLREGKEGRNRTPYQSLQRIRKREAFEAWMVSTFRNYLTGRVAADSQMVTTGLSSEPDTDATASILTDERKLALASHLISYVHQVFYPRSRFIFLRSLLTMLNKQQALPNDEMARALGMTDISYRVSIHRMKCRLAKYRTLLLRGQQLPLDDAHRQMAQHINDDFTNLYPTLMLYYGQALNTLTRADAVKQLRQEYLDATGNMLHEAETPYSLSPSVSAFWRQLGRLLVV